MKKLLLTVTLSLACVAAFAQGKVNFINDSLHLIYFTPNVNNMLAADAQYAGQAYLNTYSAQGLTVELWAGTSSTSLALQSTTDFVGQSATGKWNSKNVTLTGIAGGIPIFVAVDIYATQAGSYLAASSGTGFYYGTSGVFGMNSSATIAYNSIINHSAPASSTWADGTYALDTLAPNYKGAIMLQANVPEPTTLALAGLGAAALMIFRRRK